MCPPLCSTCSSFPPSLPPSLPPCASFQHRCQCHRHLVCSSCFYILPCPVFGCPPLLHHERGWASILSLSSGGSLKLVPHFIVPSSRSWASKSLQVNLKMSIYIYWLQEGRPILPAPFPPSFSSLPPALPPSLPPSYHMPNNSAQSVIPLLPPLPPSLPPSLG